MKKVICILFAFFLTFSLSSTACAQDFAQQAPAYYLREISMYECNAIHSAEIEINPEYIDGEAAAQYLGTMPIEEYVNLDNSGITPYGIARITFSGMAGYNIYPDGSEHLLNGYGDEELYIDTCVWAPEEISITIGLWNLETGAQYGIRFSRSPVENFTITTENVPTGRYWVYVKNNTGLIINTGYLTFEI